MLLDCCNGSRDQGQSLNLPAFSFPQMYANPGPPVADQRRGAQANALTDGEIAAAVAQGQAYQSFRVGDSDGKVQLRVHGADTNTMTIVGASRMHGYIDVHNRSVLSGSSPLIMSSSTAAVCVLFGSLHGSFHGSHSSVVCAR